MQLLGLEEQGINESSRSLSSSDPCIRNGLPAPAILVFGSNPVELFGFFFPGSKDDRHWNVVKLCSTKERHAAHCCPWAQWCLLRCPQQTISLGFEEWGAIISSQDFALGKVLVAWFSFVLNLEMKWEMWILNFFFHPATLETHWRCYNWNISFQGPTNRNSFKSGVCKAVMAEWQTCFRTSTDQGLCQVLKALWEIHYFQWNWSQGSNVPSFCTHSKGVILHFPSYHKEGKLS